MKYFKSMLVTADPLEADISVKAEPHSSLNLALRIFEAFVPVLLNANLSFNQTLLAFLFYVRQTWMTQLILAVSL